MGDVIRLLPDSVANQIAAGEVIQRPASVIKELVENAVDAGATDIQIVVKDAGKTEIRVVDNGKGMSETDVRMAFERHATSKITKADDLFTLRTMGFRGEALPSICAISEVEVKTRTADSAMGTRLIIVGSNITVYEPCVCDKGTVISVRRIFFNVPARRKFLKSDNVELANIMREFERLALVNTGIRMSIDTGARRQDLRAASMRLRIEDIWHNYLKSDHLIPVDVDTSLVKIEGFVSRPEFARRRNPLQFLIVNGRNMRHPYFHKAVLSCYNNLIPTDTQPCYFLRFTVDPSTIDVNIHPTKNEIKFEYEQQIWPILVSAVKTSLGRYSAVPSIDFETDAIPLNPLRNGESASAPSVEYRSDYNPFASHENIKPMPSPGAPINSDWERLYENFNVATLPSSEDSLFENNKEETSPSMCIQFALKYIVTTTTSGLIVIDQHRAHLKILYEEYLEKVKRLKVVSQAVMFPESIVLDSTQHAALEGMIGELRRMGFNLENDNDTSWRILSVPAMFGNTEPRDVIMRVLDSIVEDTANYGNEGGVDSSLREKMALLMARSAAVTRGKKLSAAEMEKIISALFSLENPALTPNGNPVYKVLTDADVASLVG
ncbi:MAG: DNA mismatch repair endonuclease MutL [Candidatus Amulumruptor caecigallinarius]|nr:DNA mismatch repair endonuclease MutL [Candidatus Amulumruptor caecigallinarius]